MAKQFFLHYVLFQLFLWNVYVLLLWNSGVASKYVTW